MAKVFTITEGLENLGALRTGGQGSVYKAKRMGPIISAVKLLPTPIHTENEDDKNFRDFQNEVQKLKKVNENPSPNVVKILHSGLTESGSLPFIEMEYIEGPDLEDLLKAPHPPIFTIRETIKLADHLASALSHCHKVGVKHGDIKSNNVKFNIATGNYVLLDFGLAVMSDEQRRSSLRHAGAVEFMAPEQHEGEMLLQSDVYSYGVIIYELLAGTVPFPLINKNESSRNMVMLAHMDKPVPSLTELRKSHMPADWSEEKKAHELQVPLWLLLIIEKCLQKKPEQRYADGVALYNAVCDNKEGMLSKEEVANMLGNLETENKRLALKVKSYEQVFKSRALLITGIILLACLVVFAFNSLFKSAPKDTDSAIANKTLPTPDTSKKQTTDTIKPTAKSPKPQKTTNPKKNNKTKDGLVDDVPYF